MRDPRKIINSYANHSDISLEDAKNRILEVQTLGGKKELNNNTIIMLDHGLQIIILGNNLRK